MKNHEFCAISFMLSLILMHVSTGTIAVWWAAMSVLWGGVSILSFFSKENWLRSGLKKENKEENNE